MTRDLAALMDFLQARHAMPFDWGRHRNDCVSYALGAIEAQTGRRLLRRRDWHDEASAAAVIAEMGGLARSVTRRLRCTAPAAAMRGDIGAVAHATFGIALVVVEGATLAGPGARGTRRLPRSMLLRAWSIDG